MAANTPTLNKFQPVRRGSETVPFIFPASQWIDNLVLAANTVKTYTLPTGTDAAGGAGGNPVPPGKTVTATIFRLTANGGPVWLNPNGGTAAIPAADNTAGNGDICIPASMPYWLSIPIGGQPLSLIAAAIVTISVEAWW
jgi:hypothetical protein